jgi:hypothetical protein
MQVPSQKTLLVEGNCSFEEAELVISRYIRDQSRVITDAESYDPNIKDKEIMAPPNKAQENYYVPSKAPSRR